MEKVKITNNEAETRAFEANMAEYRAIRDEINLYMGLQNQILNFAIAAIGGSISLFIFGTPSIAYVVPSALLIASMILSALGWTLIELELRIHDFGNYIQNHLAPKIQGLIGHDDNKIFSVLQWEHTKSKPSIRMVLRGMAGIGKFGIVVIPNIVFIVLFYYIRTTANQNQWTIGERILFWSSIIIGSWLPIILIINGLFSFSRKDDKRF